MPDTRCRVARVRSTNHALTQSPSAPLRGHLRGGGAAHRPPPLRCREWFTFADPEGDQWKGLSA